MKEGTIVECKTLDEKEELINLALKVGYPVYYEDVVDNRNTDYPNMGFNHYEFTSVEKNFKGAIIATMEEVKEFFNNYKK